MNSAVTDHAAKAVTAPIANGIRIFEATLGRWRRQYPPDFFFTVSFIIRMAFMAGIKPQTASFHLAKLVEGNLITVEHHGRHRYYQLTNQEIAHILESFLVLSKPIEVRSLKQSTETKTLRSARTCYDHLAGHLGVEVTKSMVKSVF